MDTAGAPTDERSGSDARRGPANRLASVASATLWLWAPAAIVAIAALGEWVGSVAAFVGAVVLCVVTLAALGQVAGLPWVGGAAVVAAAIAVVVAGQPRLGDDGDPGTAAAPARPEDVAVLTVEGVAVERYLGLVTAAGTGLGDEVLAEAVRSLQEQAATLRGDAVIGLRIALDGRSPPGYIASGTAVVRAG